MKTHRFPIGTKFVRRDPLAASQRVRTVIDHLTTTNSKGDVVAIRYVASHSFCGQTVTESDVVDTTIARGLLPEFAHLIA